MCSSQALSTFWERPVDGGKEVGVRQMQIPAFVGMLE